MGTGPNGGFGGAAPKKTLVITASTLPEIEENASYKTDYLKECCVKVMQKMYL